MISDVQQMKIYSTGLIADGAIGMLSLFTVPCGQYMPQLGGTWTPRHAALKHLRVVLAEGDPVSLDATVTVFVSGQQEIEAPLHALVGGGRGIGRGRKLIMPDGSESAASMPVLVAQTDCFEVKVTVNKPARIAGGPLLVHVEFDATVVKDVRF